MRWERLLAAACAAAMLTGPASAAGTLKVSLNADIRSSSPGVNRDDNTDGVVLHVVEGLVAYREDASIAPLLAQSVETSADGLTYTFRLRDGVRFHNGETLTAEDVVWSWNRYLDPKTNWRCLPDLDGRGRIKIESVTAPDPQTVVFKVNRPTALLLATMARTDCGGAGIVHRSSVNADGSWREPVGTGPFRLKEWKRGEAIVLERFKDYAALPGPMDGYTGGKQVLVDEVRYMIIPDAAAAGAALRAGAIDVIANASATDVKELEKDPKVVVAAAPTMSIQAFLFQTRDPLLRNPKMRQAIAMALDTRAIAEAATEGKAPANNSVVPTASPFHGTVEKQGFTYAPDKVKALLAEAGYKGEKITLITNKRYPDCYDTAVLAQSMLQAVGIAVDHEVIEWGTQLDRYLAGKYQMMAFPYSARLEPSLSFDALMGPKETEPRKVWD
ncbi:MAG: ABC transporter substrate-binding protein, partial [Ferrovibrionaceae bacterium]